LQLELQGMSQIQEMLMDLRAAQQIDLNINSRDLLQRLRNVAQRLLSYFVKM